MEKLRFEKGKESQSEARFKKPEFTMGDFSAAVLADFARKNRETIKERNPETIGKALREEIESAITAAQHIKGSNFAANLARYLEDDLEIQAIIADEEKDLEAKKGAREFIQKFLNPKQQAEA